MPKHSNGVGVLCLGVPRSRFGANLRAASVAFFFVSTSPVFASGFGVGLQCLRDPVQAGLAACRGYDGSGVNRSMQCVDSLVGAADAAGVLSVSVTLRDTFTGATAAYTHLVHPCELTDLTEYSLSIGAWFVALVSVVAARSLYTRIFKQSA